MSYFLMGAAAIILLTCITALVRVVRGPDLADRLIVLQLIGTAGVAILLLVGKAVDNRALFDTALVIALLASVTAAVFAGHQRMKAPGPEPAPEPLPGDVR